MSLDCAAQGSATAQTRSERAAKIPARSLWGRVA